MSSDMDMQEIFEIFFEECREGLDVMESGLLGLDLGAADLDVVNDIFRAAHSIKGGAATFGFVEVSEFSRPTVTSTVHEALELGYLEELPGTGDRRRIGVERNAHFVCPTAVGVRI